MTRQMARRTHAGLNGDQCEVGPHAEPTGWRALFTIVGLVLFLLIALPAILVAAHVLDAAVNP